MVTMNQDMAEVPEKIIQIQDDAVLEFEFADDLELTGTTPITMNNKCNRQLWRLFGI